MNFHHWPFLASLALATTSFAQITEFSDRTAWRAAAGTTVPESFAGFTSDTSFADIPTPLNGATMNAVNSAGLIGVNYVDVMPYGLGSMFNTTNCLAYVNAEEPSEPGVEIHFDPSVPSHAFGIAYDLTLPGEGIKLVLVSEGVEVGEVDVFANYPNEGFVGFLSARPLERVIVRASVLASGNTGEIFAFDNIAFGDAPVGTPYCTANPNSTGAVGTLAANGSAVALDNNIRLVAGSLPVGAFGFFLVSRTEGFVANPAGSAGNLCLSGDIGRYVGPGQIQVADGSGSFSLVLDLSQTPQPTGAVAIATMETWSFQSWHRDLSCGAATSNFTEGLRVTFL